MNTIFPIDKWARAAPADAGFSPEKLIRAREWLDEHNEPKGYRVVIVRGGRVVVEWNHKVDPARRFAIVMFHAKRDKRQVRLRPPGKDGRMHPTTWTTRRRTHESETTSVAPYEALAEEKEAVKQYALKHPEIRHRELAWRMVNNRGA